MAPNPISLSEINAYIKLFGPPTVNVTTFVDLIGITDLKFLGLSNGNGSEHPS